MLDYKLNGKLYELTLENGKVVKVDKTWVENTMKALDTDLEDTLLTWLEDNDYLVNEELEELDAQAKINKPKNVVKSTTERKKVVRERKANPDKEYLIGCVAEYLEELEATNITIANIGKIITFKYNNKDFKLDLTEKRVKKSE